MKKTRVNKRNRSYYMQSFITDNVQQVFLLDYVRYSAAYVNTLTATQFSTVGEITRLRTC